jgi:hypothetical protein
MMMQISRALNVIRPGASWVCRGNDYAGLEWLDETQTKPTEGEVGDAIAALPATPIFISYSVLRSRLTDAERQAILIACRTSWQIDDFVRLAQAEGEVNLNSDLTATAKSALVAAGLLTQERADVIFQAP